MTTSVMILLGLVFMWSINIFHIKVQFVFHHLVSDSENQQVPRHKQEDFHNKPIYSTVEFWKLLYHNL